VNADQVADVLGTLATFSAVVVVAIVVIAVVARPQLLRLRATIAGSGRLLALCVALVATVGSLWFSEGAHFPPCKWCWYQRIAMYPLVVLLGLGAVRRDAGVRLYGVTIAGIGLLASAWHNVMETFPGFGGGGCDPTNPCTIRWVEGLGFWTIPRMAAAAFALILTLLLLDNDPLEQT